MMTLNSLNQIIDAASDKTLYIRWSRGPAMDRKHGKSRDQVSGQYHSGLSAQAVRADNPKLLAKMLQEYSFLRCKDPRIYCWIFSGEQNGTDSDGAPTIDAETIVPVGRISDALIAKCSEYNDAYWVWARKGFDSSAEANIDTLFAAVMRHGTEEAE